MKSSPYIEIPVKRVKADESFKHLFGDNETKTTQKAPKRLTDINKLSTPKILLHLYKKHETAILYIVVATTWVWAIVSNI